MMIYEIFMKPFILSKLVGSTFDFRNGASTVESILKFNWRKGRGKQKVIGFVLQTNYRCWKLPHFTTAARHWVNFKNGSLLAIQWYFQRAGGAKSIAMWNAITIHPPPASQWFVRAYDCTELRLLMWKYYICYTQGWLINCFVYKYIRLFLTLLW